MPDLGNGTVFFQSDGSNNSGTMPSWSGSAAPSTIDDAGRALQGAVTREWHWRNFTITAAGTADAKTLTYSTAPAAYYNGQVFSFKANTTNTATCTLNVNSLGAKTIKSMVTGTLANLAAGDMVAGMFVQVTYNTADDCFVWTNQMPVRPGAVTTSGLTMATDRLLGRDTASTGAIEELSVSQGLAISGGALVFSPTRGSTVASTSGATVEFTSLPTWIRRIQILVSGVSTNTAGDDLLLVIGAGSYTTSGYVGSAATVTGTNTCNMLDATTYWPICNGEAATDSMNGIITLATLGSNIWVMSSVVRGNASRVTYAGGTVTLGGTLDRLKLYLSSTDNFDAGSVNIIYE